jgi:hypothetical protein
MSTYVLKIYAYYQMKLSLLLLPDAKLGWKETVFAGANINRFSFSRRSLVHVYIRDTTASM